MLILLIYGFIDLLISADNYDYGSCSSLLLFSPSTTMDHIPSMGLWFRKRLWLRKRLWFHNVAGSVAITGPIVRNK